MRIGVLSDTHGHVPNTRLAVRMLESLEVEQVLHCGDIGAPEIVPLLGQWPVHFVFGNVDDDRAGLREAIRAAGQTCHERFGDISIGGRRIALLHGDDGARLREAVAAGTWDLVCCGHTHVPLRQHVGNTWVLNPGAIYRANPKTLAIVELPTMTIESIIVD